MTLKALFTADLHFTHQPRDEYRFAFLPWLKKQGVNRDVHHFFILGDLTDAKDAHNGRLVNRIVDALVDLSEAGDVWILKGNHDYDRDADNPFFRFLTGIDRIHYLVRPDEVAIEDKKFLFLPHSRKWREAWEPYSMKEYDFILLHQPLLGATGDNGHRLEEGADHRIFAADRTDAIVLAGDIHRPQEVGNVIYVGSPYPVHFGDTFPNRVIYYEPHRLKSIRHHAIQKLSLKIESLDELKKLELYPDDQVRIAFKLPRSAFAQWVDLRQEVTEWCAQKEVILCGLALEEKQEGVGIVPRPASSTIRPGELLRRYCESQEVTGRLLEAGLEFLKES